MKKYSPHILDTVRLSGITVVTVKRTITEYLPRLKDQQIPGYPIGITWDSSPGGFDPNLRIIGVATDNVEKQHGSESLFDHEFAHAYDWAMGYISRTPLFEAAFFSDHASLRNASEIGYYSKLTDGTYLRAQGEAYAESFTAYHVGNARWFADKPALLTYFRSFYPRPK